MLAQIENISSIPLLLEEKFSVSLVDYCGTIRYVNSMFCELAKYSKEELIGKDYGVLNPIYPAADFISEMEQALSKDKVVQRRMKRFTKDGVPFWVYTTIMPIFDENKQIIQFVAFDLDITNNVHTEEMYKETLGSLRNIENALDQSTVVAITNQRGIITYVNEKFCELSKYRAEELIGKTHGMVNSDFHPKNFFKEMWRTIGTGEIWEGDIKNRAKDGSEYWVSTTIVPFLNENHKPYQYVAIRKDITAKKEAEKALEIALENDFRKTVKNLQNAIFKYKVDEDDEIIFTLIEGRIAEKLNITVENIANNQLAPFYSNTELQDNEYLRKGLEGEAVQFELSYFDYTYLVYLSPIFEGKQVTEVVGTAIDITERKKAEEQIERMAYYDFLTDLPNRRYFEQQVKEEIEQMNQNADSFAVMFLDLDRFKNVNDTMGHAFGDQLLVAVGERLKKIVRKGDIVGRYGGDEFVVLLPSIEVVEVEKVAKRIISELDIPFSLGDSEVFVNTSIGMSIYPEDGEDYNTLISHADSAMFYAKERNGNDYYFFSESLHHELIEKTLLEADLRTAKNDNQFVLHYQPQIDLKSDELTGIEALIRWDHPRKGMISPADFIPIAEESGLIVPIGQWVLETACLQVKKWQNDGYPPIQISVNVSIQQFKQGFFVDQVKEVLQKTGLHPKYLNLEITESMTSDEYNFQRTIYQLRQTGISVSIDDFGTGYSSLSYLSKFPITHLKIDQAFVQELSKSNRAIIKTIISLAKNLDISVIAEGVETEEQANFLKELDCDEVQGYFYSKPLPSEQIEELLNGGEIDCIILSERKWRIH